MTDMKSDKMTKKNKKDMKSKKKSDKMTEKPMTDVKSDKEMNTK